MAYKYPSLRDAIVGYMAGRDTGAAASDQFTVDGSQDGTLTNGATRVDDGGLAYSFDGADDYITLSPITPTRITVSAWVKLDAVTAAARVVAATASNFAGFFNAWSLYIDPSGVPQVVFQNGTTAPVNTTYSTPITTAWTHLAFTYDGATMRMYVNGSQVVSVSYSGGIPYSSPLSTNIGGRRAGSAATWGLFFDGLIDDVLIYPRALTATEIGYLASARGAAYQQTGTRRRRSTMGAGIL